MTRPGRPIVCVILLLASGCIGLGGDAAPSPTAGVNTPASPTTAQSNPPAPPTTMAMSTATHTQRPTSSSAASPMVTSTATPTPSATRSPASTPITERSGVQVTVTRVVDGDTIEIAYANGTADTVRLLGVDTPEVHVETDPTEFEGVPDTTAGRECLRAEGKDASAFVGDVIAGEPITLQFDDAADRRGYYGRLLAYVHHDGTNLNYRLVAGGYARVYDSTFTQSDRFYGAEADAQAAGRGLWRCRHVATATPPSTGGGELAVARVHADAAGNDHSNENDEYVVFENTGDASLDLTGWTVEDEADHTYGFPDGFTLAPGAQVTLHTGSGRDTQTDLYWGSDSAIWNNGGDTVIVSDASGTVVVRHAY